MGTRLKIMKMSGSLWGGNMTLNCDISRTSWHMKVSDGSFFWIFHALSFEPNLYWARNSPLSDLSFFRDPESNYTLLQNKRWRWCGVPPPPIIFEGRNLSQQTIHHWKGNLSKSPIHFRYRQNILISRLYEQFSRNDCAMAPEKNFRLLKYEHIIDHFKAHDLEILLI